MLGFMSSMKIHEAYQQAKYRFVQNNSFNNLQKQSKSQH